MKDMNLIDSYYWYPFASWGLQHSFWRVNAETVIMTWVLLGCIALLCIATHKALKNPNGSLCTILVMITRGFMDFVTQTLRVFSFDHFAVTCSYFWFIFLSSLLPIIPLLEEPTKDINTTLALGITAFIYIQIQSIKAHGITAYIKEYFSPIFIMFPINVIGKIATAISMSFRLFGNIFAGSIIGAMFFNAIGSLQGLLAGSVLAKLLGVTLLAAGTASSIMIIAFFGIFDGGLQAFVFFMLTLTYISIEAEVVPEQGSTS